MSPKVVISGVGIEIPGLPGAEALLALDGPIVPGDFQPLARLGRKGLLGKDRATRLALCAAHAALLDAGLPTSATEQLDPDETGVCASSNLGNLDTVCQVVSTIQRGHVRDASVLDVPNASSNIVASSIAIRFGCRAPNVMITSGEGAGIAALHIGANLIRAGRARRVIVAGVETSNEVTIKLLRDSAARLPGAPRTPRLADGAAAIILEHEDAARSRGAAARAAVGAYGFAPGQDIQASVAAALGGLASRPPSLWLTPAHAYPGVRASIDRVLSRWAPHRPACRDLEPALGEASGLLGVVQCAVASLEITRGKVPTALLTSGASWSDGTSSLLIQGVA